MAVKLSLALTPKEKQIFASLNLHKNVVLEKKQQQVRIHLAELFAEGYRLTKHGPEEVSPDEWKAEKYRKEAERDCQSGFELPPLNTKLIYASFAWFTAIRLFIKRLNSLHWLGKWAQTFLPRLLAIGGLSYALELGFDFLVIFHTTFLRPKARHEEDWPYSKRIWHRFTLVVVKDDRIFRMAAATIWLAVNASTFWVTGGLSAIPRLLGFSSDPLLDIKRAFLDLWQHGQLLMKVNHQLQTKQKNTHPDADTKTAIVALTELKVQLKKKIVPLVMKHTYTVACSLLVLAGAVLLAFPPTFIPGTIVLTTALCCTLVGGSVFGGLGRKLLGLGINVGKKICHRIKTTKRSNQAQSVVSPIKTVEQVPLSIPSPPAVEIEPPLSSPALLTAKLIETQLKLPQEKIISASAPQREDIIAWKLANKNRAIRGSKSNNLFFFEGLKSLPEAESYNERIPISTF